MSNFKDKWDDFADGCSGCLFYLCIIFAIWAGATGRCSNKIKKAQTSNRPNTFINKSSKTSGTWSTNKNNDINQEEATGEVWICVSSSSYAYHAKQNCRGIKACRSHKKKVKLEEAQQMGRRPCQICH